MTSRSEVNVAFFCSNALLFGARSTRSAIEIWTNILGLMMASSGLFCQGNHFLTPRPDSTSGDISSLHFPDVLHLFALLLLNADSQLSSVLIETVFFCILARHDIGCCKLMSGAGRTFTSLPRCSRFCLRLSSFRFFSHRRFCLYFSSLKCGLDKCLWFFDFFLFFVRHSYR